MGLTIHYKLSTPLIQRADVRALVERLRAHAATLPFQEVGPLVDLDGPAADFECGDRDDEHRWLKIQSLQYLKVGSADIPVKPTCLIGFSAWPGEGCEEANFGFCMHPGFLNYTDAAGRRRQRLTQLGGWRWKSFCKTQYASNPDCGGVPHFLRCHLCVVQMLDFAQSMEQIAVEVCDEGGYWEHRDLEKLAREVGDWNEQLAAFCGQVKDAAARHGVDITAAIAHYPNFEHLETKGSPAVQRLRDALE
jgi:hypothetical protein